MSPSAPLCYSSSLSDILYREVCEMTGLGRDEMVAYGWISSRLNGEVTKDRLKKTCQYCYNTIFLTPPFPFLTPSLSPYWPPPFLIFWPVPFIFLTSSFSDYFPSSCFRPLHLSWPLTSSMFLTPPFFPLLLHPLSPILTSSFPPFLTLSLLLFVDPSLPLFCPFTSSLSDALPSPFSYTFPFPFLNPFPLQNVYYTSPIL